MTQPKKTSKIRALEQPPSFIDKTRAEIKDRLEELEPLVKEHAKLEAALKALNTKNLHRQIADQMPSKPARRGRPKGTGTRAKEALRLIHDHPGITTMELAPMMGLAPNYLYRVLPALELEGKLRREGKGWFID